MVFDWIQGEKFKALAKWTYSPRFVPTPRDDYDDLSNTLDIRQLKDGDIVYTHMMYAPKLFEIMQWFSKRFILITHSCDCSVEEWGMRQPSGRGQTKETFEFTIPGNIIRWYTKNVNTTNPLVESIPIGLENARWFEKTNKIEIMREQLAHLRGCRNLAYMNHAIKTNPEVRGDLYNQFEGKTWVTLKRGGNGIMFERYLHQLYNHKFIFSPEGNGIDTIRTWEALYMGTIPIEKRNLNNRFYTDLPILFVNKWEDVTEKLLREQYTKIKERTWNMEKLQFRYWKDKILSTNGI